MLQEASLKRGELIGMSSYRRDGGAPWRSGGEAADPGGRCR